MSPQVENGMKGSRDQQNKQRNPRSVKAGQPQKGAGIGRRGQRHKRTHAPMHRGKGGAQRALQLGPRFAQKPAGGDRGKPEGTCRDKGPPHPKRGRAALYHHQEQEKQKPVAGDHDAALGHNQRCSAFGAMIRKALSFNFTCRQM